MNNCLIGAKRLLTPDGWAEDQVLTIEDGRITRIARGRTADFTAEILSPAPIDPHLHGGDGFDIMYATVEDMEAWLLRLAQSGVGGVLAAPYTAPIDHMRDNLQVIKTVMERQKNEGTPGARLYGAHLEGPFLSTARPGAMNPSDIALPSEALCRELLCGYESVVREMTLAAEVPGAGEVIAYLNQLGIRAQIGHSDATFEEGEAAFALGVGSVCHFFNAARPIRHRDPGFLSAAIVHREIYSEMITDFVHLNPGTVRFLWTCKGPHRIMLISDAVSTTNLPDGRYLDHGEWYEVRGGASYSVAYNALNGGGTYLPGAVRNLVSLGIPAADALNAACTNAARWLQLESGIRLGATATLTGWDAELHPLFTYAGGFLHREGDVL